MKVLIVKTSSLGDIIQTFPVVEYLKCVQKVSTIGWVVEQSALSLIASHPYVDIPLTIDSKKIRKSSIYQIFSEIAAQRRRIRHTSFDIVFDLQGNTKSGVVTFFAQAPTKVGYGKNFVAEIPNFFATNTRFDPPLNLPVREEYLSIVQQYFHDEEPFTPQGVELLLNAIDKNSLEQEMARWPEEKPVFCVAVGSAWKNKMCCKESFSIVLKKCFEHFHPYFIFIAGSAVELTQVCEWAQLFPQKSHVVYRPRLPVLQHIMAKATIVLSVDSLALHLAGTTHTPTFSFFGPSSPSKYVPMGSLHGFFHRACPLNVLFEKRCPYLRTCTSGECLKGADPNSMFRSVYEWYKAVCEK